MDNKAHFRRGNIESILYSGFLVLFAFTCILPKSQAQSSNLETKSLPEAILGMIADFRNINCYHCSGTMIMIYTDWDKKLWPKDSNQTVLIDTYAKEGKMFVRKKRSYEDLRPIENESLYLTPASAACVQQIADLAQIASNKSANYNELSAAMGDSGIIMFSFLNPYASSGNGVGPVTPSLLHQKNNWDTILAKAVVSSTNSGNYTIEWNNGDYGWKVLLSPVELCHNALRPVEIELSKKIENTKFPIERITVNQFSPNPILGCVPQKITFEWYVTRKDEHPMHAHQYLTNCFTLNEFSVNTEIDDTIFEFDPASVSTIDDMDTATRIRVPR